MQAYILTFIEGFVAFLSPCILPMIPIYISYFAGTKPSKKNTIINSIAFVIGFSIIYITFALAVNRLSNYLLGNTKYIKIIFGLIIILLGLNYTDIIKIKIFNNFKTFKMKLSNLNFIKSLFFGMIFSITITPCVGTFLASALLYIANETDIIKGFILILLYCMGLGIPFIISAMLIDSIKIYFGFIKKNFKLIRIISGLILVCMGLYLIIGR